MMLFQVQRITLVIFLSVLTGVSLSQGILPAGEFSSERMNGISNNADPFCNPTFYRKYRSEHYCDFPLALTVMNNSKVIVSGNMRDDAFTPQSQHGFMAGFDLNGKLEWKKKIDFGSAASLSKHVYAKDGGLLVLGNSSANRKSYINVSKFDADAKFVWNTSIPIDFFSATLYNMIESADGSIFIFFSNGPDPFDQQLSLLKLSSTGNVTWLQNFKPFRDHPVSNFGAIEQDDDFIYAVSAFTTVNSDVGSSFGTLITKISKSDGSLIFAKMLEIPNSLVLVSAQIKRIGSDFLLEGRIQYVKTSESVLLLMDNQGTIKKLTTISTYDNEIFLSKFIITKSLDIVAISYFFDLSSPPYKQYAGFLKLDRNLNVISSRKFLADKFPTAVTVLGELQDGGFIGAGFVRSPNDFNGEATMVRLTKEGTLGNCPSDTMVFDYGSINFSVTNLKFVSSRSAVSAVNLPYIEQDYSLQHYMLVCGQEPLDVKFTGPAAVCNTREVYEYQLSVKNKSDHSTTFNVDPAAAQIVHSTDTSVQVKFLKAASTTIKVLVANDCTVLEDSIQVVATADTGVLNIKGDTAMCPGNSIVLRADKNYTNYKWQDGSTTGEYTVTSPGIYFLEAQNICGTVIRESINIKGAPRVSLELGADISICKSDTTILSAPRGFRIYRWESNYNILHIDKPDAVIYPGKDTVYQLHVVDNFGCTATDSVKVFVKQPLPVNIGNDTSFCEGSFVTVKPDNSFKSYYWGSGETTAEINVAKTAVIYFKGENENGCYSYDTLRVEQHQAPVVNLSSDTLLCAGSGLTLSPGASFAHYLWNDGSTASSLQVTTAGIFFVTVTDQHNCTASDTARITRVVNRPANFLPGDTAICPSTEIVIRPSGTYQQYLWSNGLRTPAAILREPGVYSLTVIDNYGCEWQDKLTLSRKDCIAGIFFPNAFSPDRNGKNDLFRPKAYSVPERYMLSIYNRFGEQVFYTTDPQQGWDGTLGGKLQDSGNYVWFCIYQLPGGALKKEKGSVVLSR